MTSSKAEKVQPTSETTMTKNSCRSKSRKKRKNKERLWKCEFRGGKGFVVLYAGIEGPLGEAKVFASLSHGSVHLMSQLLIRLIFGKIKLCNSLLAFVLHSSLKPGQNLRLKQV